MDAKKKLKKYIGTPKWVTVLAWITAIACFGSLLMCTAFRQPEDVSAATKFNPVTSETGSYVYIDVVGVSDWIYMYTVESTVTTYYSAEDAEGYLYMLEMSKDDYELDEQREYWDRTDENVPQPEPYRIYGTVSSITDERLSDFADAWMMSDSEFEEYFGDKCLNAGNSPASSRNTMWTVFTVLAGLFWLMFFIVGRKSSKQTKISIQELEERGELEQAAAELDAENTITIGLDKGRATEHYLIGKKTGSVLRYEDIVWCCTDVTASGRNVNGYLTAYTKTRKNITAVNFGGAGFNELGQQTAEIIARHNPEVMVGRTKDNNKKYKEIYNANK